MLLLKEPHGASFSHFQASCWHRMVSLKCDVIIFLACLQNLHWTVYLPSLILAVHWLVSSTSWPRPWEWSLSITIPLLMLFHQSGTSFLPLFTTQKGPLHLSSINSCHLCEVMVVCLAHQIKLHIWYPSPNSIRALPSAMAFICLGFGFLHSTVIFSNHTSSNFVSPVSDTGFGI